MAEDDRDILDVEEALFNGQVSRTEKKDRRGTKYVVEGKPWIRKRGLESWDASLVREGI